MLAKFCFPFVVFVFGEQWVCIFQCFLPHTVELFCALFSMFFSLANRNGWGVLCHSVIWRNFSSLQKWVEQVVCRRKWSLGVSWCHIRTCARTKSQNRTGRCDRIRPWMCVPTACFIMLRSFSRQRFIRVLLWERHHLLMRTHMRLTSVFLKLWIDDFQSPPGSLGGWSWSFPLHLSWDRARSSQHVQRNRRLNKTSRLICVLFSGLWIPMSGIFLSRTHRWKPRKQLFWVLVLLLSLLSSSSQKKELVTRKQCYLDLKFIKLARYVRVCVPNGCQHELAAITEMRFWPVTWISHGLEFQFEKLTPYVRVYLQNGYQWGFWPVT